MKTKHGFILFSLSPEHKTCWIKGSSISGISPREEYALIHFGDHGDCESVLHSPDEILDAIKQSYDEMRKK